MKKILVMLLTLVMIVNLSGCNSSTKVDSPETNQETVQTGENQSTATTDTTATEESSETTGQGPLNSNPLSDLRIRQAIAYAIDMDAIAEGLLEGKAIPANSLSPEGPKKAEGLENYAYNPDRARALLAEANWDYNYVLDVVYYYGDQLTVDIMTAVQAYLADVGMQMTFRKLEGDLAAQLWVGPEDALNGPSAVDWDMAYAGIAALAMHEYYNRFLGGSSSNSHTPTDAVYDALINASNATASLVEQVKIFQDIQKYENANLPALPLYYQQFFVYQSDRLDRKGAPYGNEQFMYDWQITDWDVTANASGEHVLYGNMGPVEFFEGPFVNPSYYMPQKFLFDRLLIADENLTPKEGQLAESYTVSEDGKVISFTLREGLKWHDGKELTVDDVQFSTEYYIKVPTLNAFAATTFSKLTGAQAYLDGTTDHIEGINIEGNTITFTFEELDPNALMTFSQWPPLPKHLLENSDPLQAQQDSFWQAPVGSGPFMIDDVNMNDYATFVPFDQYWEKGTGNIEKIQLYASTESDPNLVINAESGLLDYAYNKNVGDANALEQMTSMEVVPVNINYTRLFFINKFPKQ